MTDIPSLPNDAPGSDRTDLALKKRVELHDEVQNLKWLEQSAPIAPKEESASPVRSVLGDIGGGAVEAPRQVVGGVRDAAQSFLEIGDELERLMPLGSVQFFNEKGEFDLQYLNGSELKKQWGEVGSPELPDVGKPSTVTGGLVRGVSQFLASYGVAGKAIGGTTGATTLGTATRVTGASAAADFFGFDGQQERLSNLVQEFPALQNPVSEFLAAKEDDPEFLGRIKNVLEGAGLDGATALATGRLFKKGLQKYKQIAATRGGKGEGAAASELIKNLPHEQLLRDAADMKLIGNATPEAPLLFKKAASAIEETATGVPDSVAAQALIKERGLSKLGANSDYYVNFARIDTPEDIQRIIQDTSSAFAPQIDEAKRGVRTNVETKLSAEKTNAWEILAKRRTGEPLNAEQSVAMRELWASSSDKLGEVARSAADNPSAENLYQFRKMLAVHHAIQKETLAARAETARALQSWAIPTGARKERMQSMIMALERTGGAEASEDLARKIALASKMENGASIIENLTERTVYAKSLSSVQEYWVNALLSGPKTHMANMGSNTGVAAAAMLERAAASRLSKFLGTEGGVAIGEAAAQASGIRGGIMDAFAYAGKSLRTGETGFGLDKIEAPRLKSISSTSWNVRSDSWLGKAIDGIGTVVNVPGRMLQAEDEFFKTIGYRMELNAQAHRMAVSELGSTASPAQVAARAKEIILNPPESIRMDAEGMAAYQTFTTPGGPLVKQISKLKHQYPVMNFVIPFVNTPANILKYTFERTPIAPLTSRYRAAMAKGGADADLALTKMAMGTAGLLMAIDLGMNGMTTGSGPGSTSEVQNWRRQGNQPYSLKVGDKMIAFNRLDPLGYHLGLGADMAEYLLNTDGGDQGGAEFEEAMAASVFAVAENVTSKSYLQGLSLLMEAVNDPDRFAPSYLERFASSFIPTGVAEVARIADPVMRQSHDMVSSMKRRIPGMSDDLPPRRDLWGREVKFQSGIGQAYDMLSPLYGSTVNPEPIDKAMAEGGWFVGMPSKTMQIDGEFVSMKNRPEIYSEYLRLQGSAKPSEYGNAGKRVIDRYGDQPLMDTLNGIVTGSHPLSKDFGEAKSPDEQEKIIDKVVADYRRASRAVIMERYPELADTSARKKAARLKRAELVAPAQ